MQAVRIAGNTLCVTRLLFLPGPVYGVLAYDRSLLNLLIPAVPFVIGLRLRQLLAPTVRNEPQLKSPRKDVPDGMVECPHCDAIVVPTSERTCPACRRSVDDITRARQTW
jgi:hypothetical protein